MPVLEEQFAQAHKEVSELAGRPDNDSLLKLYAYYKQATLGNASGERPGGFDFVRRAKFDAWNGVRGTSQEEAMQRYVELVHKLRGEC